MCEGMCSACGTDGANWAFRPAAGTTCRSGAVVAPAALALSTASQPRLRAAGGGGDQICVQLLMARPQYAIAQSGSAWATAVKALAASMYQKECRSATALSKGFCTSARHETANRTWPIFSGSSATTLAATIPATTTAASDGLTFIACLLATGSRCASAVLPGLPDHRLLVEAVDLVDQLVGEDLVDVPGALDEVLLSIERFQPGPLRRGRGAPPLVFAVVNPLGLEARVENAERRLERLRLVSRLQPGLRIDLPVDAHRSLGIGEAEECRLGEATREGDRHVRMLGQEVVARHHHLAEQVLHEGRGDLAELQPAVLEAGLEVAPEGHRVTLFWVIATAAGAPTPTASHFTSLSGSIPPDAMRALATGTAPEVSAETPMVLPRRSATLWIGLPWGTTTRKMVTREIA